MVKKTDKPPAKKRAAPKPKARVVIAPNATAQEVLAALDDWGDEKNNTVGGRRAERRALWNVLSALRGPDATTDYRLKQDTTTVIRRFALPRLASQVADVAPFEDEPALRALQKRLSWDLVEHIEMPGGDHFLRHIRYAAEVLVGFLPPAPPAEDVQGTTEGVVL
jgi:hypothetical protein